MSGSNGSSNSTSSRRRPREGGTPRRARKIADAMAFQELLASPSTSSSSTSHSSFRTTPPHLRRKHKQTQQPSAAPAIPSSTASRPVLPPSKPAPPQMAPQNYRHSTIYNPFELRVYFSNAPINWKTRDVHAFFQRFGDVARIEISEKQGRDCHGVVVFQPPPQDRSWVGRWFTIQHAGIEKRMEIKDNSRKPYHYRSPLSNRVLPEKMTLPLASVDFGMMQEQDKMIILHTAEPSPQTKVAFTVDLQHKELTLAFPVHVPSKGDGLVERHFNLRITPAQISGAFMVRDPDGTTSVVFTIETPPLVSRKVTNLSSTHDDKATLWTERSTWLRQTDIDLYPWARSSAIELRKVNTIIEVGRWLTYRLKFPAAVTTSQDFQDMCQALADHNVNMNISNNITFTHHEPNNLWHWSQPEQSRDWRSAESVLSEMQEMADGTVPLPFALRYQLEVCISLGLIQECNLSRDFVARLQALDPQRAVKILERVADRKLKYCNPFDLFSLHNQVSVVEKKRPGYCTKIPSVTITPTTMYITTPVLETSNRVIRQYQQFEDRFLRVRFTDERYKGKIMPSEDHRDDEIFSRVKRAMVYGIKIGGRHYEFLAFGNSQFREHGAYFFASTASVTAADIRDWMGDFTSIRIIAKYVSRLGQCFSTTRAIPHSINVEKINDVERNGFCFTDGVGKISPFLARMIAHHYGLANSEQDYPSVFQFRLAGCKGVLAVDPSLKGMTIQIRPSQQKFPAKASGLEICRISQFSTASLNVQLILVLSALGVPDEAFLNKLRLMLRDLQEAMESEQKALELLQKHIDFNQMTIALACMIFDGFMATKDPFVVTSLRLWRSWNLKYLKEKARIFIDEGTFLLGCTDESATLKGHYISTQDATGTLNDNVHDESKLPEIFLQIPDTERPGSYRVIEGIIGLARNPSLHPGDFRIVKAVDNPALRHLKNCIVLPQTGDRDVANMCSGGDLDGDDFIAIWDKELIPPEWNHEPMDYTSPDPVLAEGPVTVDNMTSFFVQHIKNDILSRIACAHRYWADRLPDGIKEQKCLDLAQLHSKAVDYPKTGVPATMPAELRVRDWPHWCEPKNKARGKVYHSNRVLGKLYDEVKREPFHAAWEMPFDERILESCEPTEQMLQDARDVKSVYDEAMRRIMNQHGILTEFEVFTTFVLDHHQEIGDYKFAEAMGEITTNLKQQHRELCYEKAGTNEKDRDWDKMKPFIVAMYKVTADEVGEAVAETRVTRMKGGRDVPLRSLTFDTMPLMTFPWIFAPELGRIATKGHASGVAMPKPTLPKTAAVTKKKNDLSPEDWKPVPLMEVDMSRGVVREGELFDLLGQDQQSDGKGGEKDGAEKGVVVVPDLISFDQGAADEVGDRKADSPMVEGITAEEKPVSASAEQAAKHTTAAGSPAPNGSMSTEDEVEFEFDDGEEGFFDGTARQDFDMKPSGLDRLASLVGVEDGEDSED
ncbi:unnamed protein product [Cercospora beticola]|nr:unnamed protein product [Cercospora beticola]